VSGGPAAHDEPYAERGASTPPETGTTAPNAQTQRGDNPYADYANPPPGRGAAPARPGTAPPEPSRTPPPPPTAGEAGSSARDADDRSPDTRSFIDRLFGRRTPGGRPDGDEEPGREPAPRPDDGQGRASTAPPQQPPEQARQAPPLTERARAVAQELAGMTAGELEALTQEDGPFSRAVQGEIDRRTARANRQRDEQGRYVRQRRVDELRGQARQARGTDVYKAAELEDQADAYQQQELFVRGLVENYDRVSIDPIMQALPEADRAPLLASVPDGLDGRAELVGAARRRENADRRQQRAEEDGEPELVTGIGRGRNGTPTMNDWLRGQMNR
jgi:hypothetical protein